MASTLTPTADSRPDHPPAENPMGGCTTPVAPAHRVLRHKDPGKHCSGAVLDNTENAVRQNAFLPHHEIHTPPPHPPLPKEPAFANPSHFTATVQNHTPSRRPTSVLAPISGLRFIGCRATKGATATRAARRRRRIRQAAARGAGSAVRHPRAARNVGDVTAQSGQVQIPLQPRVFRARGRGRDRLRMEDGLRHASSSGRPDSSLAGFSWMSGFSGVGS